jgi:hypothetical protein
VARRSLLKLPYQLDVATDFIYPLVLRTRHGVVEVVEPTSNMYNWIAKVGVFVYNADDVDIALLLVSPIRGMRRVYDIYVSAHVDADTYTAIIKLVELLWVGYERSYSGVVELLVGKSIKEIRKTLRAYVPPGA